MQHIWACTCGAQTPCSESDVRTGSVWHCENCDKSFGCVRPRGDGKAWVTIDPAEVKFFGLFEGNDDAEA